MKGLHKPQFVCAHYNNRNSFHFKLKSTHFHFISVKTFILMSCHWNQKQQYLDKTNFFLQSLHENVSPIVIIFHRPIFLEFIDTAGTTSNSILTWQTSCCISQTMQSLCEFFRLISAKTFIGMSCHWNQKKQYLDKTNFLLQSLHENVFSIVNNFS